MAIARKALLWCSENRWMRRNVPHWWFVKRAVRRFMPGEEVPAALAESSVLNQRGIGTVLTQLGENVVDAEAAREVLAHYQEVLGTIDRQQLDTFISVKPTQLGLDLDLELATRHLAQLARTAADFNSVVWVDMEQSAYVGQTLELVRRVRSDVGPIGVCLQAYLYRTGDDLEAMLQQGIGVRLVKGAYREPAEIAFPAKADVDRNYLALARRLLQSENGRGELPPSLAPAFATHDSGLVAQIRASAESSGVPAERYQFQMLYGIQQALVDDLVGQGQQVRVLISYGAAWYPWYLRRLAERPANVWFVVRSLAG